MIEVLRVIRYRYDTVERYARDSACWTIQKKVPGLEIQSTTLPITFIDLEDQS